MAKFQTGKKTYKRALIGPDGRPSITFERIKGPDGKPMFKYVDHEGEEKFISPETREEFDLVEETIAAYYRYRREAMIWENFCHDKVIPFAIRRRHDIQAVGDKIRAGSTAKQKSLKGVLGETIPVKRRSYTGYDENFTGPAIDRIKGYLADKHHGETDEFLNKLLDELLEPGTLYSSSMYIWFDNMEHTDARLIEAQQLLRQARIAATTRWYVTVALDKQHPAEAAFARFVAASIFKPEIEKPGDAA